MSRASAHALLVGPGADADLELGAGIASIDDPLELRRQLVVGVAREVAIRRVDRDALAAEAAEQLADRQAQRLAQRVVDRDVDAAGAGGELALQAEMVAPADHVAPDQLALEQLAPDVGGLDHLEVARGRLGRPPGLADPDHAVLGQDLDQRAAALGGQRARHAVGAQFRHAVGQGDQADVANTGHAVFSPGSDVARKPAPILCSGKVEEARMAPSQSEKASAFRALHERAGRVRDPQPL